MLPDEIDRFFFRGKSARVEFRPQKLAIEHQLEGADAKISVLVSGNFHVREMFFQILSQLLIARPVVSLLAILNVKFHSSPLPQEIKVGKHAYHRRIVARGEGIDGQNPKIEFSRALIKITKTSHGLTNSPTQEKKLPNFQKEPKEEKWLESPE